MYVPWRVHEYERVCSAGHRWRVPAWAAHPRMQGLPMGGSGRFGAINATIGANADLAEKAAAFRMCPECGRDWSRQRAIRG